MHCNAFYDSPVPPTTVLWCSHKLDGCKVVAYGSTAHRLAVYPRGEHVYSQSAHRSLLLVANLHRLAVRIGVHLCEICAWTHRGSSTGALLC